MAFFEILVCVWIASSSGAKLPSSFTKCDWKQSDCLTKSFENAMSQLTSPMKNLNVPSMDPLDVPELVIGAGSGAVAFEQHYKNLKVSGLSKLICAKVEFDYAANMFKIDCTAPSFRLDFEYQINGKILLLPIYGSGPGSIVIEQARLVQEFDLEEIDKHLKVAKSRLKILPKKIIIDLANLFDGDKALGDNVLKVMNENWPDVYADVQPSYEDAFGQIFGSVFDKLLSKVPISDLRND